MLIMVAPDSKLLKPRNINRFVLLLGFLAPLVYLFGTQFFALAGAHGEEVLADDAKVFDTSVVIDGVSYQRAFGFNRFNLSGWNSEIDVVSLGFSTSNRFFPSSDNLEMWDSFLGVNQVFTDFYISYAVDGSFDEVSFDFLFMIDYFVYDSSQWYYNSLLVSSTGNVSVAVVNFDDDPSITTFVYRPFSGDFSSLWSKCSITNDISLISFDPSTMSREVFLSLVPYSFEPTYLPPSSYSDSLFFSMFNENNFLAELGRESLKDNPKGFAPYGSLIKFLDDSVFHMSDNSLALMGYGYVYYCGHVVLLDLIALILLFIPRIIAMVLEFVTKGVDTR